MWRIYYSDRMIEGSTKADWLVAPDDDVQVVVRFPRQDGVRWTGVRDRDLWTGTDEFDPFGWGVKRGALLSDADYFAIWDRACAAS